MRRGAVPPLPFKLPKLTAEEWRQLAADPRARARVWRSPQGHTLAFRIRWGDDGKPYLAALVGHQGSSVGSWRVPRVKVMVSEDDGFDWGD